MEFVCYFKIIFAPLWFVRPEATYDKVVRQQYCQWSVILLFTYKSKAGLALDTAKGTRSSSDNNSSNLHKYSNIPLGAVHKLRLQEKGGRWFKNVHFLSTKGGSSDKKSQNCQRSLWNTP